ncbi:uncharacterized protein LOC105923785 [Fundulus heteroclitus]|uniref:uncharacterized protein LOC105923785 n=1 Tax=Fundulus heteroclitus TaxID=8078 RepID=UPI00165A7361|nr:uncharacterized protein LOC105923785 [Fundulus heteroclitus]
MNLFFLLFHLTSTVQGIFADEKPLPVHETEEDENFTLRWDSLSQTNMSLTNMICFLLLSPPKVLYEMKNGAEVPQSQDGWFSGRVHCDRDALREGRLRLHVSRLRTEDSGSYRCDLAAGYNQVLRRWELKASVNFILNVSKASHGDGSSSLNAPRPGLMVPPDDKQPKGDSRDSVTVAGFIIFILVADLAVGLVVCCLWRCFFRSPVKRTNGPTQDPDESMDLEISISDTEETNSMIHLSADHPPSTSVPDVQIHLIS